MSDEFTARAGLGEAGQAAGPAHTTASPGAMLRQARQAQGLHIVHLAAMLKVPPARLESLEADRYDDLPDMVYARALFGSACRCMKVDPAPMLALLPLPGAPGLPAQSAQLNQTFEDTHGRGRMFAGSWKTRPLTALVGLVIVAIALVAFWPEQSQQADLDTNKAVQAEPVAGSPASESPTATTSVLASPPTTPDLAGAGASGSMPAPAPNSAPVPAGAVAPGALPVQPLPPPAAHGASDAKSLLSLTFKGEVWFSVTDANGVVQLQRTASPGEVVNVNGPGTLSVVIGRANLVEVQVRGAAWPLGEWTRGNVARFEVK